MKPRYTLFAILTVAGLLLDQATKLYIDRSMQVFDSIPVLTNFFHITYVRNRGEAFSFLSDASWLVRFFIGISLLRFLLFSVGAFPQAARRPEAGPGFPGYDLLRRHR